MKRTKKTIILGLAAVVLAAAGLGAAAMIQKLQSPDENQPVYCAHRGYKGEYPENTLVAFEGAMDAGFDGVEFDLYETGSGDIIVNHDDTTDRMCGISDSIYNVSLENRDSYPIVKGKNIGKYGSLVMPTLEETVSAMQKRDATLYLNLKGLDRITNQGIEQIDSILRKYDVVDQSVIFCGRIPLLKKFEEKGLRIGLLSTRKTPEKVMAHLKECIDAKIETFIVFKPDNITQEMVDLCRQNDMQVGVYWVQTKADADKVNALGVNFLYSDHALFQEGYQDPQ